MMNRRNFLKSLCTACGAAIVTPVVLLKSKPKVIKVEWVYLHDEFHYSNEELAGKMKQAFRDTKFKQPVSYGIRGERSKFFYNGIST